MAVAAGWLWRHRPHGYLIVGAGLVMWVIESACVAVDQWYGHAASPASTVTSIALVPVFAALALIGIVPVCYLLRDFSTGQTAALSIAGMQQAGRRGWSAWLFTAIALFLAAGAIFGGTELLRNGFGMPMSWLSHTAFTDWTLPGLALLIGVALPQLTAAALIAASHRWALAASYLAGLAVIAWIAVQLLVLQRYFFLQPVIAGFGLAEVLLARIWQRQTSSPSPSAARTAVSTETTDSGRQPRQPRSTADLSAQARQGCTADRPAAGPEPNRRAPHGPDSRSSRLRRP